MPLARKPTTGMSASLMIRVRTDSEAIDWASGCNMGGIPDTGRVHGKPIHACRRWTCCGIIDW